jgi:lambda family phage minor tail protein L
MSDIAQESQSFSPDDLVVLFELDATSIGGSILRFTSSAWEDKEIKFDANTYSPVPVEAEGFEWNGRGTFPTPTLRISNVNKVASAAVIDYEDLLGATVKRIRTFRQFLDDGASPDTTATFPIDIYKVERKTAHNKVFIEWELSSAIDQEGRKLPARQVLRDACTHRYRTWNGSTFNYTDVTCPYVGTALFDEIGTSLDPTTEQAKDRCGKKLSDCRLRFTEHGKLPTRAFPGLARIRA